MIHVRELTTIELDHVSGGSLGNLFGEIGVYLDILANGNLHSKIGQGAVSHAIDVANHVGDSIKNTPH
jgi:hypothetical protein